jgi:hypothetical protein
MATVSTNPTVATPSSTAGTQINYLSRDFNSIRADLINWSKLYHPDKFIFINDATPDMMYLEMVAFVGDMLSFYTDKTFNESFLSTAQAAESITRIAKDLGFFETGSTPAQTQVTLTLTVPFVTISGVVQPDPDYLVSIKSGMALQSDSGVSFEVLEEVNFADQFNRNVIPNLDGNNLIINFTITKTAVAIAGQTKIQRFFVSNNLAKPFLVVTMDDQDITQIVSILNVPTNTFVAPIDDDFNDPNKTWTEVRALSDSTAFLPLSPTTVSTQALASFITPAVQQGVDTPISKRFIVRRDVNDIVSLTFGSSSTSFASFNNMIQTAVDPNTVSFNQVLNNTSLGEIPLPNSTLFIKYRVGGGEQTNIITGQLNTIVAKNFFPASPTANLTILQQVRNSLSVANLIPALGGKDVPSSEEIRVTAGKVFAAQDRAVTYEDVKAILSTMPPEFGRPFRISYEEMKPMVANFQQVENGVNTLMANLLADPTAIGRQLIAQQISSFMANLRTGTAMIGASNVVSTLDAVSLQLLGQLPTLWIGEKARLYVLGIDESGQLLTAFKDPTSGLFISPNQLLKQNIQQFLISKRVIGDWIDVVDARVVNFQVEFTVLTDKKNKQQVLVDCLNKLRDYFNSNNWNINQPIMIANVVTALQEINGVVNVVDISFYNIFGLGNASQDPVSGRVYQPVESGRYRNNSPIPASVANNRYLMMPVNNIIVSYPDQQFEIRFPESDLIAKAL